MKKKSFLAAALAAALALSACGVSSGENNKTPETVSKIATSSAITAVFKNSESTVKKKRLENDFIRTWGVDYDYMQENLDGTDRQLIEKNAWYDIVWLTNDWVYFEDHALFDGGTGNIYRAPYDDTVSSLYDIINDNSRETVVSFGSGQIIQDVMVTDSGLLYGYWDLEDQQCYLCRYDLDSQEQIALCTLDSSFRLINNTSGLPVVIDNKFFMILDYAIYSVDFDTYETEEIYSVEHDISLKVSEYDGMLYFTQTESSYDIYRYDGDKVSCILDKKTLQKQIETMNLCDDNADEIDECSIWDLNVINGKLYLSVFIEWEATEHIIEGSYKGKSVPVTHNRNVLVSAALNDTSNLQLEDALEEYILDHLSPQNYTDVGDVDYDTDNPQTKDRDFLIEFVANYDGEDKVICSNLSGSTLSHFFYDVNTGQIEPIDETVYAQCFNWYCGH